MAGYWARRLVWFGHRPHCLREETAKVPGSNPGGPMFPLLRAHIALGLAPEGARGG